MKQKAIALILSAALALSSIGTAPILAAETTAQEAAPVEETTPEEAEDNSEEEHAQEETEETAEEEATQEEATEAVEEDTAPEELTDPEAEDEQGIVSDKEAISADENVENTTTENSSDSAVEEKDAQPELNGSSEEVENVRENASMDIDGEVVASGTCGENATWVLVKGEERSSPHYYCTLYIMGTGPMTDWEPYKNQTPWERYKQNSSEYEIQEVIVSEGITTIGNAMLGGTNFTGSTNYRHQFVNKITLPSTIERIGDYAFSECDGLCSVNIPNGTTYIGSFAFYNCRVEDLSLPDSVSFIGEYAFVRNQIKKLTVPENMSIIGEKAFYSCGISELIIPDTVLEIGSLAFSGCGLDEIYIPSSVTYISKDAFSGEQDIGWESIPENRTISVDKGNKVYDSRNNCNAIIEKSTDTLIIGCNRTIIPDNVLSIGSEAFEYCEYLTSLKIPVSVTSIGNWAFYNCSSLTNITIPSSVTSIGKSALYNCSSLSVIHFNGNAPSILSNSFDNVAATAYYPANDPTWTEDVRQNYGGTITWVPWEPNTGEIENPENELEFSLFVGNATSNVVVIGEDGICPAVAYYDFSNNDAALNEAKNIEWTCSDTSAIDIYDPVYDLETNAVRISLSLRGKKPGSYTITGTAPDGRKASANVVVEPKIVAMSDGKTISETTDVEMIQITLDNSDKEYLTRFLNGITGEIKDDIGTIGGVEARRIELSDDGKTGKLIFTLTPVYGGSCEFTLKSTGGQKIVETIYSGKNYYPGNYIPNTVVYYHENEKRQIHFDYSIDDCVTGSSLNYNADLAHLLISLATSAYQGENSFTLLKDTNYEYPTNPLTITESLRNLGFSPENGNIIEKNYYEDAFDPNYKENSTAFSLATKETTRGDKIVMVIIRGSYGGFGDDGFFHLNWSRWASDWRGNTNFKNYGKGLHEGFEEASDEIVEEINSFLSQKNIDKESSKFVITGHSRGAAVANLVSKKMIDSGVSKGNIYDYNFACPDSGRDYDGLWNEDDRYGSIFNINNVKDIVGVIPGNIFNFSLNKNTSILRMFKLDPSTGVLFWGKYGKTYFFANDWGTMEDTVLGNPAVEHQPTYYLNFLSEKPSINDFRSWTEARAALVTSGFTELGRSIGIFCPVDVTITNIDGIKLAEIKNGEQTYFNDSFGQIVILTAEDQSMIYLKNDQYKINLQGTDDGTLVYYISDNIIAGDDISFKLFENIELYNGKTIENVLDSDQPLKDTQLLVLNDEGIPTKRVLEDGTEESLNGQNTAIIETGTCGENLTWTFDSDGKLFITGNGEMDNIIYGSGSMTDYPDTASAPWHNMEVKKVVIDEGITSIGTCAFCDLDMTSVILPKSMEKIGNYAFEECHSLSDVTLPDGLLELGKASFAGTNIQKIEIPDTVSSIGENTFTNCNNLEQATIKAPVNKISNGTFSGCSSLKTVHLPNTINRIEKFAFLNCTSLTDIYFYGSENKWNDVIIEKGLDSDTCIENAKVHFVEENETITIDESNVSIEVNDQVWTGKPITPVAVVKCFDEVLAKDTDFVLSYTNNTNVGKATITITGVGNYEGAVTKTFKINPASISSAAVTGITVKTYTGKALTQSPVVKSGSIILNVGTDYTVSYKNNINVGTATVTITGKGNYTGTITKNFTISRKNQALTLTAATSSIDVGKTTTVKAGGAKETSVYMYSSSNTKVATVSEKGVVTGKSAGIVTITVKTPQTKNYNAGSKTVKITVNKVLKKPGNCHFTKWNNSKYTGCRISWNKVDGAEGYQTLLSWTDGSHSSATIVKSNVLYRDCTVHPQHVSQMKVRAFYTLNGQRKYGPWSNLEYITPSPAKLTTKNASSGSNLKMNISWNIIYGCNGYNVFITTNPNGKWYWNQSTTEKATATSASIDKCGGAKLKKNTRYYVRIVTRRKRNGVFCTVPMPANNTYIGSFVIK